MADLTIRPYQPRDLAGVKWLYERTPPAGRTYVRPQPVPDDLLDIGRFFEAFWVAVEDTIDGEALVGIAGLRAASREKGASEGLALPDFAKVGTPLAEVRHFAVAPERQRRGIGRRLMEALIDWAASHGFRAIVLNTTADQVAAVEFYRALGFREAGRTTHGRWELVWFERTL